MNDTIKRLNQQLAAIDADRAGIEDKLRTAWGLIFMASESIKTAVSKLEASNEYTWDKFGEIASWIRMDLSEFKKCREAFADYMLEEHHTLVDFENDALICSLGPCIVINHDGDVYDQDGDKFFIKKSDYQDDDGELNEAKRNELIEAYMEKSGYFPGVFRSDYHGNLFAVKTQA